MLGHTHNEHIQIFTGISDPTKPLGVNFYAGSITTHQYRNPSFNVIEFDAEYMIPINIKTYSMDLV